MEGCSLGGGRGVRGRDWGHKGRAVRWAQRKPLWPSRKLMRVHKSKRVGHYFNHITALFAGSQKPWAFCLMPVILVCAQILQRRGDPWWGNYCKLNLGRIYLRLSTKVFLCSANKPGMKRTERKVVLLQLAGMALSHSAKKRKRFIWRRRNAHKIVRSFYGFDFLG